MAHLPDNLKYLEYKGPMSDQAMSMLVKQVEHLPLVSSKVKTRASIVLIELCSNIISHHFETTDCEISINEANEGIEIIASNLCNPQNSKTVYETYNKLKSITNIEDFFFETMNKGRVNRPASLGLIRIYRICKGNMEVEQGDGERIACVIFKIRIYVND